MQEKDIGFGCVQVQGIDVIGESGGEFLRGIFDFPQEVPVMGKGDAIEANPFDFDIRSRFF